MRTAASCFYCALPITGTPITLRVGEEEARFCCRGCSLIYQLLGRAGEQGQSALLWARFATGVVFGMVVMLISWSEYLTTWLSGEAGAQSSPDFFLHRLYLPMAATAVMAVLGLPIATSALRGLRQVALSIDVLITLGIFAAYGMSLVATITGDGHVYYDTATMILVLVTLGRLLESRSKADAAAHLRSLFDLHPKEASVVRQVIEDGVWQTIEQRVPAAELRVGDQVRVRPGEAFPVDGTIVDGAGGIDQSALTGEAIPVYRRSGERAMAGTIAVDGAFLVAAERVGDQTTVARLAELLEEAKSSKLPIVRVADRLAAAVIPVVLALAVAAAAYWSWADGFERGLLVAMSVLLIACPCALGLAAPLATWMGLGSAASRGVIVHSAAVLEDLARVRHVFFDKTGTLTTGTLTVATVAVASELAGEEDELLAFAGALEALSPHPAAQAIHAHAVAQGLTLPAVVEFRAQAGLGVQGVVGGRQLLLGSRRFLEQAGVAIGDELTALELGRGRRGEMVVFLAWGGAARALFALEGTLREDAAEAVAGLHRLGISVGVLTGDGRPAAEGLKARLPIDDVRWGLLPEQKLAALTEMKRSGRKVAMVGDGVNDAPALAAADVGLALGSGADLAREAADVTLFGSNIARVGWTMALARGVRRTIASNLFWACCYNAIGIPLAVTGVLTPVMSAGAMVLSSLFVIGNSTRLRHWAEQTLDPRTPTTIAAGVPDRMVTPCRRR